MATITGLDIIENIATGKSNNRPYSFEIERFLSAEGYRSEVLDYFPATDGKGYDWKARIWKRDPMIVTDKEYYRITNCSGGSRPIEFSVEEMQEILIAHGYEIIIHVAKAEINERESVAGTGEVRSTGRRWVENVERILAVTEEDKKNLPIWNDSGRASYLSFENVFNRLMKLKLRTV